MRLSFEMDNVLKRHRDDDNPTIKNNSDNILMFIPTHNTYFCMRMCCCLC